MATLTDDVAIARTLQADLKTAVRALGNSTVGGYLTTLNDSLNPALDDPASVDQSAADAIGAALSELRISVLGTSDQNVIDAEFALHNFLSQAMVDHFDASLDWYQAAGTTPNQAGGKRKPDPS